MKPITRWLPHPLLSLLLWGFWLLLNNTLSAGHLLLGAIVAWIVPLLTVEFWPERVCLRKPWLVLRYIGRLFHDILVANLQVAHCVLRPNAELNPTFILLEMTLTSPWAISALATTVSITPGTVTCDIIPDQRYLLIHVLHTDDPVALGQMIKQRYEQLLREILTPC